MMKRVLSLCMVALLCHTPTASAQPFSLYTAYLKALEYDAQLKVAKADHAAKREEINKARAMLLPSLQASASGGRNATKSSTIASPSTDFFYNTRRYEISARQPVLNLEGIAKYGQSKAEVRKSEALLKKEQRDLVLRIAEAYFNLLYTQDQLVFAQGHVHALKEQLEQANSRYKAGYGTVTEINEVQAEYDMAIADVLESANAIEINQRKLENITGLYPFEPYHLAPETMRLGIPEPHDVIKWIARALRMNPDLGALQEDITIASKELERQRYAAFPTIDLVASRSYTESANDYSIGSTYDTYSLNLQLKVPPYSGGYTSAAVRQAKSYRVAAYEQLSFQEKDITTMVRQYYTGIEQGISRIRAYEQAVRSREIALTGTKKGYTAGLRSNVDVLRALEDLLLSRRNLAKSRYEYILNRLFLMHAAGMLTDAGLQEIDAWLAKQ